MSWKKKEGLPPYVIRLDFGESVGGFYLEKGEGLVIDYKLKRLTELR